MRDLLVYLLVRSAVGLFGLLPAAAARRLGDWGGLIWYLLSGRKVMVRRHLRRVTQAEPAPKQVRQVFRSYGRYWAETFWVRPRRVSQLDAGLHIDGLEHLAAVARSGQGAVIVLPHLGNWEAAALSGPRVGLPIVAVAEKLANARLTAWFTSLREAFGIEILLNQKGVMRAAEAAIRRGGAVCLLADRDLSGRGVTTPFFGEETTLPAGPVVLAGRTGAPLLSAVCYFTPSGHHLIISPPLELAEGPERLAQGARAYAERLEASIRPAPEQWHLLQPNWPSDRKARR